MNNTLEKMKLDYRNLMRNGHYEKAQTRLLLIRQEQERLKNARTK